MKSVSHLSEGLKSRVFLGLDEFSKAIMGGKERARHKYHKREWDAQQQAWKYFYKDISGKEQYHTTKPDLENLKKMSIYRAEQVIIDLAKTDPEKAIKVANEHIARLKQQNSSKELIDRYRGVVKEISTKSAEKLETKTEETKPSMSMSTDEEIAAAPAKDRNVAEQIVDAILENDHKRADALLGIYKKGDTGFQNLVRTMLYDKTLTQHTQRMIKESAGKEIAKQPAEKPKPPKGVEQSGLKSGSGRYEVTAEKPIEELAKDWKTYLNRTDPGTADVMPQHLKDYIKKHGKDGMFKLYSEMEKQEEQVRGQKSEDNLADRLKLNIETNTSMEALKPALAEMKQRKNQDLLADYIKSKGKDINKLSKKEIDEFENSMYQSVDKKGLVGTINKIDAIKKEIGVNKPEGSAEKKQPMSEKYPVAHEILQQLGGNKFRMFTGAKDFVTGDDRLIFGIGSNPKGWQKVQIVLNANDLYDLTFAKLRGGNITKIEKKDIGVENLVETFEQETGLYTKF